MKWQQQSNKLADYLICEGVNMRNGEGEICMYEKSALE